MGYLLIDHTSGQGIDGGHGYRQEFETANCHHCQALIAILVRCKDKLALSNVDIARASLIADKVSTQYVAKFKCRKCKKNICRACAEQVAKTGCCEPFEEKAEKFFKKVEGLSVDDPAFYNNCFV